MNELYAFLWNSEYVFSMASCYFLFASVLKKRKQGWLKLVLCFFFMYSFWYCRAIPGYDSNFDVCFYLGFFVLLYFTSRISLQLNAIQSLYLITNVLCLQHLCYKIQFGFISLIDISLRDTWWYFLIYLFVVAICCLSTYFLLVRKMKLVEIKIQSARLIFISITVIVSTILISFYTQEVLITAIPKVVLFLINLYAIIICIIGMSYLYQTVIANQLKEENHVMELLIEKDKQRYKTAKITAEKIRIKYHDLKHEMEQRKLDEEEMKEFEETKTNYQTLMYSGNKALDLVLVEKVLLANKEGCHIKSVVDGSLLNFMHSYEVYALFSNLLDNAIEACHTLEKEEERMIFLSISLVRKNIVILTENYFAKKPLLEDGIPITTKKDKENHGYGIKSIVNTITKYNGVYQFSCRDNLFEVKLVLPKKEDGINVNNP